MGQIAIRIMHRNLLKLVFINTERLFHRRGETDPRVITTFLYSNASYDIAIYVALKILDNLR